MVQTISDDLEALRAAMSGPVFGPDDEGYDHARKVWNADIDRRPAVIARCASTADVSTAIAFAQQAGLEISVRGGAHNAAGTAVCDGGLMVDLSLLNQVTVDPEARRTRVGGGALQRDVDAATQAHGLAVPVGLIGHRHRWPRPGRRHGVADPQVRPDRGQSRLRRGGNRRRSGAAGSERRAP